MLDIAIDQLSIAETLSLILLFSTSEQELRLSIDAYIGELRNVDHHQAASSARLCATSIRVG